MLAVRQLKANLAPKLTLPRKPVHALLLVALLVPTAKTCAADNPPTGSGSHTVHSCSPNYTDQNKLGRLSIQQKGPGTSIQWGTYPKLPADRYVVSIYVGSKKVDGKKQSYPPHGSLPARTWDNSKSRYVPRYKTGQILKITGTSYNVKGAVVQEFYIKCKLV